MMRIEKHPILKSLDQQVITIIYNGVKYSVFENESIAAALLANRIRTLRYSEKHDEARGLYCGVGHCYECRVTVDGERSVRACMKRVQNNMCIESQRGTTL
ncbi:(2Fe-2S)-binding protein [Virgibacillus salexigens]|uniref:(2Fe-2S)-binding protein n=1 Tax=Virgibacillus salexigens TaxID=61016 RepID=UPI00190980B2|nr:(2Fe-2S)-binding protein [Virgibacillus salexigens]